MPTCYLLKGFRPIPEFVDGQPTKKILGSKLEVLSIPDLNVLNVKLPCGPEKIGITAEEIAESNSACKFILVELVNLRVITWKTKEGLDRFSLRADSMRLVGGDDDDDDDAIKY